VKFPRDVSERDLAIALARLDYQSDGHASWITQWEEGFGAPELPGLHTTALRVSAQVVYPLGQTEPLPGAP
jgi:hypothetical protein